MALMYFMSTNLDLRDLFSTQYYVHAIIKGVFDFRSFLALFRLPAKCPKNHPIFLKFLQ